MRTRGAVRLVVLSVLWLLSPAAAHGQATGSITGTVTIETGEAVGGLTIQAVNTGTKETRSAVSADDGVYSLLHLPPGTYDLRVAGEGFVPAARKRVTVAVESTTRVDLQVALDLDYMVDVAEKPLLEASRSALGITVGRSGIEDLPLNGRNVMQLGTLIPGVVAPPAALGGASGDATPGGFGAATSAFSVNGMRNQSNNFLLDGASNNDTFNSGFVMRPPPDAIDQFKILTHNYSAEYGRSAGSVVSVVTRAGGNSPHGALWEFNRGDARQARNYFAANDQPKPRLEQNQFGAAFGGPVVPNTLFGFGYYEGHRNISGSTTNIVTLSDAQRRGDFSGTAAIRDPQTGQSFPDNVIPAERLDPAAQRLIADFLPRANTGVDRYVASPDSRDDRNQFGARLDAMLGNQLVTGRYLESRTGIESPAPTRPVASVSRAVLRDAMVSHDQTFGVRAFNQLRVSVNRIAARPAVTSGLANDAYLIGVPQNVPSARGLANIAVTGLFNLGDVQQPFVDRRNDVVEVAESLTVLFGRHQLGVGAVLTHQRMRIAFVNRPNGDFTFIGAPGVRTGNAAADFLLGLPAQFRRTTANAPQDGTSWMYAGYVQDDFRVGRQVTINAGLRYELAPPFTDARDALNAFRPGEQSLRFPQAPAGLVYPGDPGVPRGTYATDRNNLAPRLGAAWNVGDRHAAVIRAGWGIYYDSLTGQGDFFQNGVLAPPFTPLVEVNAPPAALTLRDPLAAIANGPADFPPGLTVIGWGQDFTTPSAQHFNIGWQQMLRPRLRGEIAYVGSRGHHLPIFMEVNPGAYVQGQTAPGARLFPAFALVRPTFTAARSWYDSLQANLELDETGGIKLQASYTLGHARDHVSGLNIGGEPRPVLPVTIGDDASIERALRFEKGDALFDVRHRFVVAVTAPVPGPKAGSRAIRLLAAGWQVNGLVQLQSGYPVGVFDPALTIRYLTNRPDQICDPNAGAPHTVERWFDTSCFVQRPLAQTSEPGSTPRNSVRGPGFARTDLAVVKFLPARGDKRLQLRVEAFNLFNQARFGQPGNQVGTPTFGRITTADDGRIIQLALKYTF